MNGNAKIVEKEGKNGKIELILKWTEDGRPKQEKLKLFYVVGKTTEAKKFNLNVKKQVDELLLNKEMELLSGANKVTYPKMLDFFKERVKARGAVAQTYKSWYNSYNSFSEYLTEIGKEDITTIDVDTELLLGFVDYMSNRNNKKAFKNPKKLKAQSVNLIVSKVKTTMAEGLIKGYFKAEAIKAVKALKVKPKKVDYLTKEEVEKMINIDYKHKDLKLAFIFSLYTGLRISDVKKLHWKEVDLEHYKIEVTTQKTKSETVIPITKNLMLNVFSHLKKPVLLDENSFVFPKMHKMACSNVIYHLQKWGELAGIKKHIHFHICRHTLAVNLIENGADIYTVSKILTHTNISTTTKYYADVTDKKKVEALNLLNY